MRRILSCLILIFLLSPFFLKAQQFKQFTSDPEIYLEEMKTLFARDETNYKKGKDLLDRFEVAWIDSGFSPDEKERIYETSNLMLKRKARNFPHYYNYINLLLTFKEFNTSQSNFTNWEDAYLHILSNRKTKLSTLGNYLIWSEHLIRDKAVAYSRTVKWFSSNNDYKIIFQNDTVKVEFESLNLTCKLRRDSLQILETSGTYYPLSNVWKGNEAIVTWEKAGISKDTAWAEISGYTIPMKKSTYTVKDIKFYHKVYFDYPIIGTLTDKVVEIKNPKTAQYPRFESNETRFKLNDIAKNINYQGGFSMKGSRFLGTGTSADKATLKIYRDIELVENGDTVIKKVLFMQTRSLHYAFKNEDITSVDAQIAMYIDTDSIFHPGLRFKYENTKHQVSLIRESSDENKSKSPYYDTYHQLELDFELLNWQLDEPLVHISMLQGSATNVAKFESRNYFSQSRYYEVQGLEEFHPYVSLRRFARYNDSDIVHAEDFARYIGFSITPVRRMFIDLAYKGILAYDIENEVAVILPKMYNYLDAMARKVDYDLIIFESTTIGTQSNALLNLTNMDLEIKGVPEINVSDSQNVVFYPKNQELLFKRNRDFDFGGSIEAGFFTFYGDNFQFKYDSFLIKLNQIDSLSIKVKSGVDNWGQRVLSNVESVIEDVTGDLAIDDPNNKSGNKSYPEYPVFTSDKESFVYYDDPLTQKGKYTRDRFYFQVEPYVIDSLNDYSTEGMGYNGQLISSDIFPIIKQRLTLQPDNSLGFIHTTPEKGLPLYKGIGQYYSTIKLSNQGLKGEGDMTYLTSRTSSDELIFLPDSTNTYTSGFFIGKKVGTPEYPDVKAGEVYVHFMPYLDELFSNTVESPYQMYTDQSMHMGHLKYTPDYLTGSGTSKYYQSSFQADSINFFAERFRSDSVAFTLNSLTSDSIAFTADNVQGRVSFTEMKSTFRGNKDSTEVTLPENLYLAYVKKFSWLMKEKTMQLETPNTAQVYEFGETRTVSREEAGLSAGGSLFISVHKGQDSLQWRSPIADIDLKTNTISAHEVKYIAVADARIFPNKEEVIILPKARLETFYDTKVLANTTSRYHDFHDATINISSRKKYSGEGYYNYEDELGRFKPISMYLIAVDSLGDTFAKGKVLSIDDFSLSPVFKFQGNVLLSAPKEFLEFTGATKITHECDDQIAESWVKFSSEIDPNSIYIPIPEQPMDINDNFLVSGPMIATDSVHLFPSFLSPRKRYSNTPVITAQGYLYYDKKTKEYKIGEKYRIHNNDTIGNFLSLNKNYCNIYGEGDIDLTENLGQVKVETKGSAIYNLPDDKLNVDILMTIDFFFPQGCYTYMSDTLTSMTGLKAVNLKSKSYQKALKELIGYNEADLMFKEQAIFGMVKKLPEPLTKGFVFSDLKMTWNKEQRAWQSIGELGIASIQGVQLNKKVKGHLEIEKKRSGDSFTLYLEISEGHWYFFSYKRGLMQAYSSEEGFNNVIADTKGSDRKQDIERGEQSFVFFLSNMKKRNDFLKKVNGEEVTESENEFDDADDFEQYDEFD